MARNYDKQHVDFYGSFVHDFGQHSFSGGSIATSITTTLSKIVSFSILPAQNLTWVEVYSISEPSITDSGLIVGADKLVAIRRLVESGGTLTQDSRIFYHFIGID